MTWEQFFNWLMDREARAITNDPRDPGGQTCWGISRRYHPTWPGWRLVDAGFVARSALEPVVSDFYRALLREYWEPLPPRLAPAVCDAVVNMGAGKTGDDDLGAVEILQLALNRLAGSDYVEVDGDLGPQTRAAIKTVDPAALAFTFCAFRQAEYNRRARRNKSKQVWLGGWLNRVSDLMRVI